MEKEKIRERENTKQQPKKEIAVPGEIIATDIEAGEWTRKEGKDVIALRFGIVHIKGGKARVIPLSGAYMPKERDVVIGEVVDISFNGWFVDINSPCTAFLPVSECRGYIDKQDLASYYNYGDMIIAEIKTVKPHGINLSMREIGKKLSEGIMMNVNCSKVPRIIGKEGSMVEMIKKQTACEIAVGQNGIIWIRGEKELEAKNAIKMIEGNSLMNGLTEYIKEKMNNNTEK